MEKASGEILVCKEHEPEREGHLVVISDSENENNEQPSDDDSSSPPMSRLRKPRMSRISIFNQFDEEVADKRSSSDSGNSTGSCENVAPVNPTKSSNFLDLFYPSPTTPTFPKKASRTREAEVPSDPDEKEFKNNRIAFSRKWFQLFNEVIFCSQLPEIDLCWSSRLLTTAGQTTMRRKGYEKTCSISLSNKVLSNSFRARKTLLHEMCHCAQFLLEGVSRPPHGKEFVKWAQRSTEAFPDFEVTTTHSYEIFKPHQFRCVDCGKNFGRHSKSIKVDSHRCTCFGKLVYVGKFKEDGTMCSKKQSSQYGQFISLEFQKLRELNPEIKFAEAMRILGRKWKSLKQR
eukprot:GHVP01039335.1.p1 GENE.GHVP01039335.1~~GHVP01039335.1.p1  ORF type:complete len:352 (+),score=57.42 GHVP01039335.1:24-1058(+)